MIQSFARMGAILAVAILLAAGLGVRPAEARWLKAESERFIVYSEGNAARLTTFVQKLETYDRLLRRHMGLDENEAPLRKLPIYLVRDRGGINAIWSGAGSSGIAGFYRADEEDIFAVAIADGSADDVLLHEYAHHFMMQYFPYGYPAWFIEGFAEYFSTVDIKRGAVVVGNFDENNGAVLRSFSWLPMRDLLGKRFTEIRRQNYTFYPLSWLLTHWFMGSPERHTQLAAYLRDVGDGGDPVEAMPRATGVSNGELRSQLRRYMNRIPYYEIPNNFPVAEVTITEMPAWADDLLLLSIRLKLGVEESRRPAVAAEARRAVARYPDVPFAQILLGHAEIHFGDRDAGERVLRQAIERHPEAVDAHLFLATSLLERAEEDEAGGLPLRAEAQHLLAKAYQLDETDYRVLMLLARVREGAPGYPTANDIATHEIVVTLAPQLNSARLKLAEAYLGAGRNDDAIHMARALANAPHSGEDATRAQALITRARGLTEEEAAAEAAIADAVDAAQPDDE